MSVCRGACVCRCLWRVVAASIPGRNHFRPRVKCRIFVPLAAHLRTSRIPFGSLCVCVSHISPLLAASTVEHALQHGTYEIICE